MSIRLDLSGVVRGLSAATVTLRRWSGHGVDAAGYFTRGTSVDSDLAAVMCRPTARVLRMMDSGIRSQARWLCHTTEELRCTDPQTQTMGDQILYEGRTFEVLQTQAYTSHGAYYRSVLGERDG